ncbi:uncharacterized protein BKA55DRAFT_687770 [Fusarium redolens]|uniref:Uncharacterized protein n=1 Tax=Fusarium redolens TaxID=48865 RepID=A0A9P9HLC3_FUSRE|nr:uncharacterized protein BKA55DRAFT_687770 [Fusarium redolens]KAH7259471.1 hypothetical protein BKA55DRAFT_687770 [Fusarium redolens]
MLIGDWESQVNECDDIEITRRLIDLFFISVLLDAGDTWRYTEPTTGQVYERSEGIAVLVLIFSEAWESHYLTTRTSSEHRDALEDLPVNFLSKTAVESSHLDTLKFWDLLPTLLIPVWPKGRTVVDDIPIGDAWPLSALRYGSTSQYLADSVQRFHKPT